MPVLRTWRCGVACLISSRGLNQPHHITNAALASEVGGIAKRIKTASPSVKNQSSEIRLSENANKKRSKCEAFHVPQGCFLCSCF